MLNNLGGNGSYEIPVGKRNPVIRRFTDRISMSFGRKSCVNKSTALTMKPSSRSRALSVPSPAPTSRSAPSTQTRHSTTRSCIRFCKSISWVILLRN